MTERRGALLVRRAASAVFWLAVLAAAFIAVGAALATTGALLFAAIEDEPLSIKAVIALRLLGLALVVGAGAFALRRGRAPWWSKALTLAAVTAVFAARYQRSLHDRPTGALGNLRTVGMPGAVLDDRNPHRPPRRYTLNGYGLRGPEFSPRADASVLRVAVVGDSFVFGVGLYDHETLSARLQSLLPTPRNGRRLEVLNLGIPGNNLPSNVTACEHAWSRLGADLVVLLYHVPNDFARWDEQDARRDEGRVTPFSALSYLVGTEIAVTLVNRLVVDGGGLAPIPDAAPQLEVLDEQLPRLHRAQAGRPLIVVPVEFQHLPGALERFARRPNTVTTRRFGFEAPLLLPFDGHPNPAGTLAFAEAVRAAGPRLPQWSTLFNP